MTLTPEQIAAGLSDRQRKAILAFTEDNYSTTKELGVHGRTLQSMNPLGDVDPVTLEIGPILVTHEWAYRTTYWKLTGEGLAVRKILENQ